MQVVTAVVARLTVGKAPMTLQAKCKTSEKYWGKTAGEETLVFHKGELLTGTMDKAQYGKYGLVHGVQVRPGPSPPPFVPSSHPSGAVLVTQQQTLASSCPWPT